MKRLAGLSPSQIHATSLAGEEIQRVSSTAKGNGQSIGGIQLTAPSGWFVARPSGTEPLYKIYAESFEGPDHLQRILDEAQAIVDAAIAPVVAPEAA
jgi:phosphoglucomutase